MEYFLFVGIPGLVGGVVIALLVIRFQKPSQAAAPGGRLPERLGTSVINMARIRVAGVGGLGMVAMAIAVAAFVPRIRETMTLAVALGIAFGVWLIVHRRRVGPLPSSGARPGARSELSGEAPLPTEAGERDRPSGRQHLAPGLSTP